MASGRRPLPAGRGSRPALAVPLLLALATLLAFSNSCSGAFVLDDIPAIVENPHIRTLTPIAHAIDAPPQTTVSGRPTVSFSLALNHALAAPTPNAAPSAYPFHVGNILIHLLAGLTLFGVLSRTLRSDAVAEPLRAAASVVAATIALLWLVHPLQTAAVTYIVQRAEALMALFLLLTLYCAIRAHDGHARPWSAAAVIACALGMGSKEVMVVAPVIVAAWDWLFASRREGLRALWTRRWPLYAGLAATWALLAMTVWAERRPGSVGFGFGAWPWWRYLATQAGVVLHYLRLAFVPRPLVLDYGWPPAGSIAGALPAIGLVAALVLVTAIALARRHAAAFAGVVFFLVLAPTSSVLPIVTEVAAEHRMYLPLAAVLALVVAGSAAAGMRLRIPAPAGLAVVALAAGVLVSMTRARNADYATEERIWADTVAKRPDNPRARINYGVVLLEAGRLDEAEPHLRRAVALAPDEDEARLALGAALCSSGRCDEGLAHLQRAAELDPRDPNAARNLAEALAAGGRRREAAAQFRRAVELLPDDVFVLNQASWLLATAPEPDVRDGEAALAMAERAVRLTGGRDPVSLDSLAVAHAELGRWKEAEAAIRAALDAARQQPAGPLEAQLVDHQRSIEARTPIR